MKALKILPFYSLIVLLPMLGACNKKPPACADEQTVKTAKNILVGEAAKLLDAFPDDPDGLIKKFIAGLKVEITEVVNEGYKEDAKKQLCQGKITVTTIEEQKAEQKMAYATQTTEDKDGGFLLEIEGAAPLSDGMQESAARYYLKNRWAGVWSGTYACSGLDGPTEPHQGAFSQPVSLVVDGSTRITRRNNNGVVVGGETEAMLERTTQGGGIEKLTGVFGAGGLRLSGRGENTPDDQWETSFEGKVNGKNAVADGVIRLRTGMVLRQCHLELTQAAPTAKAGEKR